MPYRDLREFIEVLDKHGELQRIEKEVHWNQEAGAILRRTYELDLPAPFFQKVTGYPQGYRLFGGTLSNHKRVALALDMDPDSHYQDLMKEYLRRREKPIKPRLVKDAPCKENILIGDDVDLLKFPAPMAHEGDGGRFLCTWHTSITKDRDSDWVNWGMYRGMIQTRKILGIFAEANKHIGMHYYRGYEPRNEPMPIATAIGTEPVCAFATVLAMGPGQSEVEMAGAVRGEPVDLVKCETIPLEVPATSEIVIEGEILPNERMWEGPFGEFTGYRASPRDMRPIIRVKAITYRNDPILSMSCMGVPVDEGQATQSVTKGAEMLAELIAKGIPVVDAHLHERSAGLMLVVGVKVPYANIADEVAHVIWGHVAGRILPYIVVVEDDVNVHDLGEVMHAIASKCHPYRGIRRVQYATTTSLMPFLTRHERLNNLGAKAYFDCTWPTDWDPSIAVPPKAAFKSIFPKEVQEHVLKNWKAYGYTKGIPK
ncbi:UbiD family decarboxylase [Chloroflexota bacterium]